MSLKILNKQSNGWKVFVFDFDGTLVDSYSCLPLVYEEIAEKLGLKPKVKKILDYLTTIYCLKIIPNA